jgi:hypothetical protein
VSIILTVNNIPFEYPEQGEQQPWGEAATGWATEVTRFITSTSGPADILESSASIENNKTTNTPILGLFFDPTITGSFRVTGHIYIYTTGLAKSEEFTITGLNVGSTWLIQQEGFGDSGVIFDLDNSGQFQYKSSNTVGFTSGVIKFKGTAVLKT